MVMADQMVCVDDFEKHAFKTLPKNALDYYRSGANDEITLKDNIEAFRRWKIRPRVLRDVSSVESSVKILDHKVAFPVCVASTAMHRMAHTDGEVATAQGAADVGTLFTLSTIATSSIEEIAEGAPNCLRFFQVYIYRDRDVTVQLIRRAEQNGFKALVLTVDTPFLGKRLADNRNKFKLPAHLSMANFKAIDFTGHGVSQSKNESGLNEYVNSLFDPSLTWDDIKWLKTVSKLPIVLKGILTGEDAKIAVEHGVNGIVVSNHGARQLDKVPATIELLSEVVNVVGGKCEVYLDGGVRTGTDVFIALALGAKCVFVGRPAIYGVAYNGAAGVSQVLGILRDEFRSAMALAGCARIEDVRRSMVVHESYYKSIL